MISNTNYKFRRRKPSSDVHIQSKVLSVLTEVLTRNYAKDSNLRLLVTVAELEIERLLLRGPRSKF